MKRSGEGPQQGNGTETELFRLGDIALVGTAGPTPGYNESFGEWLHAVRLIKEGSAILHVAVNHTVRLNEPRNNMTALRALAVRLAGAALTGSGKEESGGVSVSVELDLTHEVPLLITAAKGVEGTLCGGVACVRVFAWLW